MHGKRKDIGKAFEPRLMKRLSTSRFTRARVLRTEGTSTKTPARALVLGALAFSCVSAAMPEASASLLAEPPRLTSFKLDDPSAPKLSLLRLYYNAEVERRGPLGRYFGGPWGRWKQKPWISLQWHGDLSSSSDSALPPPPFEADVRVPLSVEPQEYLFGFEPRDKKPRLDFFPDPNTFETAWLGEIDPDWSPPSLVSTGASLSSNGFNLLYAPPPKPVRDWRCRRRPVTLMRFGAESQVLDLLHCDGSVAPDALDRVSIMLRPPDAPAPGSSLPDEPSSDAWQKREWLPQIRIVHPRLLWALQRVADAFPFRAVYIYSGYRPGAIVRGSSHHSLHSEARAIDVSVFGIPNVVLFDLCRKLDDVGCGFYPNGKFVHIDVRRPGVGHPFWIDASGPGEPPRYVDSWPGVITSGGMAWSAPQDGAEPSDNSLLKPRISNICSSGPAGERR